MTKTRRFIGPGAPWLAVVDFDRAGDQHLADPAAARGHDDRVVLGAKRDDRLVGLDQALSSSRSGLTMARRSLAHSIQAVRVRALLFRVLSAGSAIGKLSSGSSQLSSR